MKPIDEIVVTKPENIINNNSNNNNANVERKIARPQKEQALNCPRCNSTNTKFCYYNNYSLTQPRYFCKTCRRYWTEGGSLRNIPVGGGSRKNKRSSFSSSTPSSSPSTSTKLNTKLPDLIIHPNQKIITPQAQDLNLTFPPPPPPTNTNNNIISGFSTSPTTSSTTTSHHLSALELLTGLTNSRSEPFNSFLPMPVVPDHNNASGFSLPEFKPSLSFSLDGYGGLHHNNNVHHQDQTNSVGSRILFPFEDLKQVSPSTGATTGIVDQQNNGKEQGDSSGFWTGMLGGF